MPFLKPDKYFNDIYDISPAMLKKRGFRGVVLDIDNTLVTYDDPEPFDSVRAWFCDLEASGIKIAFVSNNESERVRVFNSSLGYPAFPKGNKPLPASAKKAMKAMGTDKSNTLVIGDQVFTDVLFARLSGLRAYLVPPIKDKLTFAFRFKRALEKPVLAGMEREGKSPDRDKYFKKKTR